jgi:hypothetical protein
MSVLVTAYRWNRTAPVHTGSDDRFRGFALHKREVATLSSMVPTTSAGATCALTSDGKATGHASSSVGRATSADTRRACRSVAYRIEARPESQRPESQRPAVAGSYFLIFESRSPNVPSFAGAACAFAASATSSEDASFDAAIDSDSRLRS